MNKTSVSTIQTAIDNKYCKQIINLAEEIVRRYREDPFDIGDRTQYYPYKTILQNKAHQNNSYLTGEKSSIPRDKNDNREFYQIIDRVRDTSTANTDFDSDNLDIFSDTHPKQEFLAKSLLRNHFVQTNFGEIINDHDEKLTDDGNLLTRYSTKDKKPYLVDLANVSVSNPLCRTLEETDLIEDVEMTERDLRDVKEWINIEDVIKYCNSSNSAEIPSYTVRYLYAQLKTETLNGIRKEIYGEDKEDYQGNIEDCLIVYIKAYKQLLDNEDQETKGFVVYADKVVPETVEISKKVSLTFTKPYIHVRDEAFCGRLFGKGIREIGVPYQNKANKIGQKLNYLLTQLKLLYHTTDKRLVGKSIEKGFKEGQVIVADDFKVFNNHFPNLDFLIEEWNRNIQELEKSVKAFESASGEALPSSTSATAIAVSNNQIGKYYKRKRQIRGFYFGAMIKRWDLPYILKNTDTEEKMEIIGDPAYLDEYAGMIADQELAKLLIKTALEKGVIYNNQAVQLRETFKKRILTQPKIFHKLEKEFFESCKLYVGINATNENNNKQTKVANGFGLINAWNIQQQQNSPQAQSILEQITKDQGYKIVKNENQEQIEMKPQVNNNRQAEQVPEKEKSLQSQVLEENKTNI